MGGVRNRVGTDAEHGTYRRRTGPPAIGWTSSRNEPYGYFRGRRPVTMRNPPLRTNKALTIDPGSISGTWCANAEPLIPAIKAKNPAAYTPDRTNPLRTIFIWFPLEFELIQHVPSSRY
jgi:hypothetical protein